MPNFQGKDFSDASMKCLENLDMTAGSELGAKCLLSKGSEVWPESDCDLETLVNLIREARPLSAAGPRVRRPYDTVAKRFKRMKRLQRKAK